jgi:hypothetical protein
LHTTTRTLSWVSVLPARSGTTFSRPSFPYEFVLWLLRLDIFVSYISSPHFIGRFQYIYLHFAD